MVSEIQQKWNQEVNLIERLLAAKQSADTANKMSLMSCLLILYIIASLRGDEGTMEMLNGLINQLILSLDVESKQAHMINDLLQSLKEEGLTEQNLEVLENITASLGRS
jgi:hypothetical protein